jgi:hypothetical protein
MLSNGRSVIETGLFNLDEWPSFLRPCQLLSKAVTFNE